MALTRSFKDTVQARVARDPAFKQALLTEGVNALLEGDIDTGKAAIRRPAICSRLSAACKPRQA